MKAQRQWLFPLCDLGLKTSLGIFADLKVHHRDRLRFYGPTIVVSNHISNLDPPVLASVMPRKPLYMAKRELFSNPLFSFLLKGWGAFPVHREAADLRALNWAQSMLKQGKLLVLFPEGTRSRNNHGIKLGHIGAALLAARSRATVIPIGLYGTETMQHVLRVFMPSAKIRISVGKPFKVRPINRDRLSLRLATDELMARIARQLPATRRGKYRDRIPSAFEHTVEID